MILDVKCETQFPSVQATKSGAALKTVPKLSKHLVAYMEGLLAVSPYYVNGPFDSCAKGVVEAVAASELSDLNKPCMAYLKSKGPKTQAQAISGFSCDISWERICP